MDARPEIDIYALRGVFLTTCCKKLKVFRRRRIRFSAEGRSVTTESWDLNTDWVGLQLRANTGERKSNSWATATQRVDFGCWHLVWNIIKWLSDRVNRGWKPLPQSKISLWIYEVSFSIWLDALQASGGACMKLHKIWLDPGCRNAPQRYQNALWLSRFQINGSEPWVPILGRPFLPGFG